MNNSKGVRAMLKNDTRKEPSTGKGAGKKRKSSALTLVPENERVLQGISFFWIPEEMTCKVRTARVDRTRNFGALLVTDQVPDITHIVVEKHLTYADVVEKFQNRFHVSTTLLYIKPSILTLNVVRGSIGCYLGQ